MLVVAAVLLAKKGCALHARSSGCLSSTGAMDGIVAEYLRQENIPYFDMQAAMYTHVEGNDALLVCVNCQVSSFFFKDDFEQVLFSLLCNGIVVAMLQVI